MRTLLVTGANRGLGLEFVRRFAEQGGKIIAGCRHPQNADQLQNLSKSKPDQIAIEQLDVSEAESIGVLANKYKDQAIDMLINNAGLLGPNPIVENFPRQHFGSMDYELWAEIIRINTFGPVRMAEAFVENVARSGDRKIICLSSSVGSIESRRTPSMAYPSSKAALNKSVSLMADQLKERNIICVSLCPGHVKTRMGVGGAELEIEDSVTGMIRVIESLTLADTGSFTRYDGARVLW